VDFEPQALKELSDSIKEHGLIQPITVRHLEANKYQLISGERRLRASKMAGLTEIPAYIRLANDETMMEMALIENIQRQDLNAVEIAITFDRLMKEFSLTHDKLSERVGKERSTITNYVSLLKLPPEIQTGIQKGKISMGHAKALKNMPDVALQLSLYREIVEKELSVRKAEELAQRYKIGQTPSPQPVKESLPTAHQDVQKNLAELLNTKVVLKRQKTGQGQIVIHFANDEQLNAILDVLDQD
jgi:ParB family chromosome partitioning protein